jgi:hypothetical protein
MSDPTGGALTPISPPETPNPSARASLEPILDRLPKTFRLRTWDLCSLIHWNLERKHNVRNTNLLKAITESVLVQRPSRFLTDFNEMQYERNKNLVTRFFPQKQQKSHMKTMFKFYQFAIPIPQMCLADKTQLVFRHYAYKRARRERVIQSLLPNLSNMQLSQLDLELVEQLETGNGNFWKAQEGQAGLPSSELTAGQTSHILNDISAIPTTAKPGSEVSFAQESVIAQPRVSMGRRGSYGAVLDKDRWMKCVLEDYDLGHTKGESKDVTVKIKTKRLQSFNEVSLPATNCR